MEFLSDAVETLRAEASEEATAGAIVCSEPNRNEKVN